VSSPSGDDRLEVRQAADQDNVIRLDPEATAGAIESEPIASSPGRLNGLAITGMALCALIGILAMLAFITVRWPQETGRYPVSVFIGAGIGFLACASAAVFTAARDTYLAPRPSDNKDTEDAD